jgi:twitching motility protein PilI
MARKTSLREFQQNVAQRIRDLASQKTVASKLGFQVGTDNWLVTLTDVSEVIPVPNTIAVPLTLPWFRGVANIRGKLYSLIDFSAFQGKGVIGPGMERRAILISDRLIEGSGLMVSRMLGLRNPEQFTAEPIQDGVSEHPWIRAKYRDPAGVLWHELDAKALVGNMQFLEVGNPFGEPAAAVATSATSPSI